MSVMRATRFAVALVLLGSTASAQVPAPPSAADFVDPVTGMSLDAAIARAREAEPSLRAARSALDVARGSRMQAALRPNPSFSIERRQEPAGTDNQTSAAAEWPLDLFRRAARVGVADQEVAVAGFKIADSERLLAADVRTRYGEVLTAARDLQLLDELVATTRRQHELLRARVDEGASPALERDLLQVELRRLEADRLLQVGRTEAAMFQLKRLLALAPESRLTVANSLESLVTRAQQAPPAGGATPAAVEGATSAAAEQRPDVQEAEARVAVARARLRSAERDGRFDVKLFGSYMRMDAGFPQSAFAADGALERIRGVFHYATAGAMVTVPLFNRNQGEIAIARAEQSGAAASSEAARLSAAAELAAARALDDRARAAVALFAGGARTLARQNLDVVLQSYQLGRTTVYEVLAEQRRYLELERAYTDALRNAYEARTALVRAGGEL
jgi:cobalt-zinc-cadmium efflux system outer membrane protein